MTNKADNQSFSDNLEQVTQIRQEIANDLDIIADNLETADLEGLEYAIADIKQKSHNLRDGVFRIFVLGDVKRGKSTVINALIGEDLLPRDVNACTGLITVLRYGAEKKITIYFKDDTPPEEIDFDTFRQDYTVSVDEAKKLDSSDSLAFPNVQYAVVEYPLALLESGIEIIDSPGLNDTEARNQLSLGYVYNCQAILFVLRAVQPFTLEEKRYLDNYIKDRGLNVFFLINGWDEIANELIDPDDQEELAAIEAKSREYFQAKLTEYLPLGTSYQDRVFEISALNALRSRLKNNTDNLAATGYTKFTTTLNNFLAEESAIAELNLVKILAEQTYNRVHEIVERQIPLSAQTEAELQAKIAEIKPEFTQLEKIRDRLIQEIEAQRDLKAKAIANSFEDYVLRMENSFEVDFFRYEPELETFDFLIPSKRDEFYAAFKKGFDTYVTNELAAWEKEAEKDLEQAFTEVLTITEKYNQTYHEITESINTKLIGRKIIYLDREQKKAKYQWKNWTIGCLALASGNVAGVALAGAGFNWKSVLINWLSVFGISRFVAIFTGMMLTPYAALALGLGVAGVQVGDLRKNKLPFTEEQ
ncbi:Bacterial dynamin-like protein [Hyella patelloides LEGE 07179]|uniref:Bacterial dynamin-like protein n=1 Tax=Hyella patelloides LEGE 07179 TaxID=945734 RepID=A0A563VXJ7_9CYAN|nr:dynamin family protein [Hyella patelloides]VEP16135.1 Bacterial dynamin-like protein [Hyella patelloides LEGE 07179]